MSDDKAERYVVTFEFDCEGEPPSTFIVDRLSPFGGTQVVEVFEVPTCRVKWSWEADDWTPCDLALMICSAMNGNMQ